MSPLRGIALKLAAIFLFTIMAALIKTGMAKVPPGEAVFFRSIFAVPVILGWLALRGDLSTGLKINNLAGHVWRGLFGVMAMGFGFASLGMLPLPEATVIGFAAPLMVVILAAVLLGERLRLFRLGAVGLGLVGVMVVIWPRLGAGNLSDVAALGAACALISAALRAVAQVHIRKLVGTEQTSAIVFYFSLTASVMALFTVPFGWVWPDVDTMLVLISAGLVGGFAQILVTSAYRHSEAALLAPFDYASILFATLFGYLFFDEIPTASVLVGAAIVVMAGVLIIWRERQLGLKRGAARPNLTPNG